jgi:hypothetical protein
MKADHRTLLLALLLVLLNFLFYFQVLDYPFFVDDQGIINNILDPSKSVWSTFRGDYFRQFGAQGKGGFYRPMAVLSFYADTKLWGTTPLGFHLTNLIIQCVLTVCVFFMARKFFRERNDGEVLALFTGALFATFSRHSEVVAWIAARPDLMAACFACLSLLMYQGWLEKQSSTMLFASSGAALAAFLSKESALTIPFLWLALHIWRNKRKGISVPLALGVLLLSLYFLLRWNALGDFMGGEVVVAESGEKMSLATWNLSTVKLLENLVKGILGLLVPAGVFEWELLGPWRRCFYQTGSIKEFVVFGMLLMACLGIIYFVFRKPSNRSGMILLLVLLGLSMLPVLPRRFPLFDIAEERLFYFPSVFFVMIVGYMVFSLFERRITIALAGVGILIFQAAFLVGALSQWKEAAEARRALEAQLHDVFKSARVRYIVVLDLPFVRTIDVIGVPRELIKSSVSSGIIQPANVITGVTWYAGGYPPLRNILWERRGKRLVGTMSDSSYSFRGISLTRGEEQILLQFYEEDAAFQPVVRLHDTFCQYFHRQVELEIPPELFSQALFVSSFNGKYRIVEFGDSHP